jgi:hypothetical protein
VGANTATGTEMRVSAPVAAGAMNDDGTMKLDVDGEPIPVGNEAQQKVAQMIADSFKKAEDGVTPDRDLNLEIKEATAPLQTQSSAGPTPAEMKPVEQPAMDGSGEAAPSNDVKVHAEVKGKGTVTPPNKA